MENHTVVTRQSWFSRLGYAFKGVLVGILLLLGGIVLLWWNEGRAITTAKALAEGAQRVLSVVADRVDPGNQGKLVHVAGRALAGGRLADPDFPFMAAQALVLQRKVEMFQWQEEHHTKEVKKLGGGVEKQTTYTYKKAWSSSVRNSSHFYDPSGHRNPSAMPYASFTIKAPNARLGAFRLPAGMLALSAPDPLAVPENAPLREDRKVAGGQIYIGKNPDAPEIGDLRIQYTYAPEQDVSVVAGQMGDSFGAFSVGNGKRSIQILKPGLLDADAMFNAARNENAMLAWLLRALGALCACGGVYLVLRPLSVLGDVVPFIGGIVNFGAGLVALVVGLACSLIVIALAWMFYRPLLGMLLLATSVAALAGTRLLAGRSGTRASLR